VSGVTSYSLYITICHDFPKDRRMYCIFNIQVVKFVEYNNYFSIGFVRFLCPALLEE
jgi:hypothetical protein